MTYCPKKLVRIVIRDEQYVAEFLPLPSLDLPRLYLTEAQLHEDIREHNLMEGEEKKALRKIIKLVMRKPKKVVTPPT